MEMEITAHSWYVFPCNDLNCNKEHEAFVNPATLQIVGEIQGKHTWEGKYNYEHVGSFMTRESAKIAVEKAHFDWELEVKQGSSRKPYRRRRRRLYEAEMEPTKQ